MIASCNASFVCVFIFQVCSCLVMAGLLVMDDDNDDDDDDDDGGGDGDNDDDVKIDYL